MVNGDYGAWEIGLVLSTVTKGDDHRTCVTYVLISLSSARTALESKNKYNAGDISVYSEGNDNLNIYPGSLYKKSMHLLNVNFTKLFYWEISK